MPMTQKFKEKWLENLGKYEKRRYGLSDGNKERCVIAAAYETAVELEILPQCDLAGRDLLTDEELRAIGLSSEEQYYLSTMNDQFHGVDGNFGRRIFNAIDTLPTRELLLIPVSKETPNEG